MIFFTPAIVNCMEQYLDITKPRYSEDIFLVFWHFVISRFHCSNQKVKGSTPVGITRIFFFQLKKNLSHHILFFLLYRTSSGNSRFGRQRRWRKMRNRDLLFNDKNTKPQFRGTCRSLISLSMTKKFFRNGAKKWWINSKVPTKSMATKSSKWKKSESDTWKK